MPYYILLVGSPQRIPFEFGQNLDVEYAVGRVHFDTVAEYRRYVQSVIDYETGDSWRKRQGSRLLQPAPRLRPRHAAQRGLSRQAAGRRAARTNGQPALQGVGDRWGFRTRSLWGPVATKAAPSRASFAGGWRAIAGLSLHRQPRHGLATAQRPAVRRPGRADLPGLARLRAALKATTISPPRTWCRATPHVHGLIAFLFACYGAGTPLTDRFVHKAGEEPPVIAQEPFIAALPKALLAHERGGALACIGHVERAWGYSDPAA